MTIATMPSSETSAAERKRADAVFPLGPQKAVARLRRLIGTAAGLLFVASVVKELRTPKEARTWHGTIFGRVPYDLRPPTPARFKEVYWNTESHRLLGGRVFGVGWGVNLYEVVVRARRLLGRAPATAGA